MGKRLSIAGEKYGKLTAVEEVGKDDRGSYLWRFVCDCGGEKIIRPAIVKNGNTSSCGCVKKDVLVKRNTTHNMSKHPAYSNWKDMFKRCYNPNNKRYKDYNERGIGVDPYFKHFPNFLEEIGEKPDGIEKWSVGRIDNNKGYEPGNVRWETLAEQARNHTMQKNNTSGIVGVKLQVTVNKHGTYESWVATWSDGFGNNTSKTYSTIKYGFEEAKQLAIKAREDGLRKLKEQGIEYADSHGSVK
jgi:hypothetical protein